MCVSVPWQDEKFFFSTKVKGHKVLSQLFGGNDLFTTMFTAKILCGKLQGGILHQAREFVHLFISSF